MLGWVPLLRRKELRILMNAASRSVLPQQRRSRRTATHSKMMRSPSAEKPLQNRWNRGAARGAQSPTAHSSTVTGMPLGTVGQNVEKLKLSQETQPLWLSSLLFLQRSSDVITFLLVAATLTIYSWTVYTQQQWSQEYGKLQKLQRDERQLTTANAVIKDQLAQQAEKPGTGLVPPTQANTIFLQPAPQRPFHTAPNQSTEPEPPQLPPLGY